MKCVVPTPASSLCHRRTPVAYSYDAANRQTGMTDVTGTTGWVYDDASRATGVSCLQGTTSYTYDGASRRATMTLSGNNLVTYGYDDAGQLERVRDWESPDPTTYTYDANGNRINADADRFTYNR